MIRLNKYLKGDLGVMYIFSTSFIRTSIQVLRMASDANSWSMKNCSVWQRPSKPQLPHFIASETSPWLTAQLPQILFSFWSSHSYGSSSSSLRLRRIASGSPHSAATASSALATGTDFGSWAAIWVSFERSVIGTATIEAAELLELAWWSGREVGTKGGIGGGSGR